jgi:APA family basic amino acid/polyamine antiporter
MTFARYFIELTGSTFPDWSIAVASLVFLTGVNCLGVRTGGTVQSTLTVIKIAAITFLIICGYLLVSDSKLTLQPTATQHLSFNLLTSFGAAMVPVMFAFGGWQTANFIAGEIREPEKNLPRGLLIGVVGVVVLYIAVNIVCLRTLGADGLARSLAPASDVMRAALGERGAMIIALGITISTFGFLSQGILTAPRVYYAMAQDGLFFKSVATLHPRTRVPSVAIILQGLFAIFITLSGTYEQILSYVVSDDFIFFGLSASCLFIFRARDKDKQSFMMPGHPYTTGLFIIVCIVVVANTIYKYPINTLVGIGILLTGIPVYYYWKRNTVA